MSSEQITQILFGLFGGLAIFIYGMNLMGSGLQKLAGEKLRRIIEILTGNPILGILVGAVVTALIQSSSATTVIVVGFVGARLMTLPQAISVIMGANIGTTATAWLVSIKIGHYAYPIAAIGFMLYFFPKNKKLQDLGHTIFAFGLLFVGLNTMSGVMKPLSKAPEVAELVHSVANNRVLGVIVGTALTAIIQSSSAVIAILQKISTETEGLFTLESSLPLLYGSNIGTTVTALLASIGASVNAKRAALAHSVFNIVGSLLFIFFVGPFSKLVEAIMLGNVSTENMDMQIAVAHSIFNVLNTLIWFPFISVLAKIVESIFRGKEELTDETLMYIDKKVLSTPAVAMDLAINELVRMANITVQMVLGAKKAFINADKSEIENVLKLENTVDILQGEIITYLSTMLSQSSLTEKQSLRLSGLMHVTHDIEKIGDHCQSIVGFAQNKIEQKIPFSDEALAELSDAFDKVHHIVVISLESLSESNIEKAKAVLAVETEIDNLETNLRLSHIERLNTGLCNPNSAITFIELIHHLEQISDNCQNVAEAVIDDNDKLDNNE